jgi:hypothetical protein
METPFCLRCFIVAYQAKRFNVSRETLNSESVQAENGSNNHQRNATQNTGNPAFLSQPKRPKKNRFQVLSAPGQLSRAPLFRFENH